MDPSRQDKSPVRRRQGESSAVSPTDNRNPITRAESSTRREDDGLSESFQSTDTVRRRPEGGYGMLLSLLLHFTS